VVVSGEYAYVVDDMSAMHVISIANPAILMPAVRFMWVAMPPAWPLLVTMLMLRQWWLL